jgi:hypothetical protein
VQAVVMKAKGAIVLNRGGLLPRLCFRPEGSRWRGETAALRDSSRLMTAEGHERGAQNEQMLSALLPKADVRLARSNKYTPLATCKTYARCGFVLPPDASDKNLHALVMCLQ